MKAPIPELEYVISAAPCTLNEHRLPVCIGGTCNGCLGNGTYLVWNSAVRVRRVNIHSVSKRRVAWVVDDKTET